MSDKAKSPGAVPALAVALAVAVVVAGLIAGYVLLVRHTGGAPDGG